MATFVWSRTLESGDIPAVLADEVVEMSALPPPALLDELDARGLQRIRIDGGQTLHSFLAKGLVDVTAVTRIPLLIGRGILLFGGFPDDVRLGHLATQILIQRRGLVLRPCPDTFGQQWDNRGILELSDGLNSVDFCSGFRGYL